MKILMVNNHHKRVGGAETYYFALSTLLSQKGHQVAHFSMKDFDNLPSPWQKYFVSNFDLTNTSKPHFLKKCIRMLYSLESRRKITHLLNNFKPDIIHVHNLYYYISPSILPVIKSYNIPIVQTVHDYHLISPNLRLFDHSSINESTKKHKYYKALASPRLYKSFSATLISIITSYTQYASRIYENNINVFICPSQFMKDKLIEYNFKGKTITHLPNFIPSQKKSRTHIKRERYILFVGAIDEAKGALFLLEVMRKLSKISCKFAGEYADIDTKKRFEAYLYKHKMKNTQVLGYQHQNKLNKYIQDAQFIVVPSLWYENQPYIILESYSQGKPVIASNIGGIPEIVIHKKTGLLFQPGNIENCVKQINILWQSPNMSKTYGQNAVEFASRHFSPQKHYQKLLAIYKEAINPNHQN